MDTILANNEQAITQIQSDQQLMEQLTYQYDSCAQIIHATNETIKF